MIVPTLCWGGKSELLPIYVILTQIRKAVVGNAHQRIGNNAFGTVPQRLYYPDVHRGKGEKWMEIFVLKTKVTILGSWWHEFVVNPTWRKSSVFRLSWIYFRVRIQKVSSLDLDGNIQAREMIILDKIRLIAMGKTIKNTGITGIFYFTFNGAQKRSWTSTGLLPLAPQASASTIPPPELKTSALYLLSCLSYFWLNEL